MWRMPALTDTFTLSNGVEIPKIGFGTWQIPDGQETYDSVRAALDTGYRHIDTARAYDNEAQVGQALKASCLSREAVFLTTKLWNTDQADALATLKQSLNLLETEYVDLYLIH